MDSDLNEKAEIEAKFICPDCLDLNGLITVVNAFGFQYTRKTPYSQTDIYFDTPAYTLLKTNTALRIRQKGESYTGTCKISKKQHDVIFERSELEWSLSGNEIKLWHEEKKPIIPPKVIEKLNLSGETLKKVLRVETYRHIITIHKDGEFKAELSLDKVTFHSHNEQKVYREIEVELLHGQFEHFKQAIDSLQNQLQLQPAIDSKYRKGLLLIGKHDSNSSPLLYETNSKSDY
ncbi:MAG: CYTH domain-containing protein [Candidatus Jettenia caeni]|nr:MAG: CYTH domain-containing protein [Candidatus Jettenia caeni]